MCYRRLFYGAKKKFKVKRKTFTQEGRIQREDKDLEVTVKPGMKAGSKFKFKGVGDEIEGTKQDLHLIVAEKPHPLFERKGDDLIATVSITLKEALTGWSRQISTVDGKNLMVSHTGPTPPTWTETYPYLGMVMPKDPNQRGNLLVKVNVSHKITSGVHFSARADGIFQIEFPATLTADQKSLLKNILP